MEYLHTPCFKHFNLPNYRTIVHGWAAFRRRAGVRLSVRGDVVMGWLVCQLGYPACLYDP